MRFKEFLSESDLTQVKKVTKVSDSDKLLYDAATDFYDIAPLKKILDDFDMVLYPSTSFEVLGKCSYSKKKYGANLAFWVFENSTGIKIIIEKDVSNDDTHPFHSQVYVINPHADWALAAIILRNLFKKISDHNNRKFLDGLHDDDLTESIRWDGESLELGKYVVVKSLLAFPIDSDDNFNIFEIGTVIELTEADQDHGGEPSVIFKDSNGHEFYAYFKSFKNNTFFGTLEEYRRQFLGNLYDDDDLNEEVESITYRGNTVYLGRYMFEWFTSAVSERPNNDVGSFRKGDEVDVIKFDEGVNPGGQPFVFFKYIETGNDVHGYYTRDEETVYCIGFNEFFAKTFRGTKEEYDRKFLSDLHDDNLE